MMQDLVNKMTPLLVTLLTPVMDELLTLAVNQLFLAYLYSGARKGH